MSDLSSSSAGNYSLSITAICFATLANAYLVISVFPYSGFMAMQLVDGLTVDTAGLYAGLLASSFMFGRALSSYAWGQLGDVYGRKPVLMLSLSLLGFGSIIFGLSTSFTMAIVVRFFLGLSNGVMGTTVTLASELARGDSELETRGMGVLFGMWGWGFLVSPALSGVLSEPIEQNPGFGETLQEDYPKLYNVLEKYPFILPNIVGFIFCAVAVLFVIFFTEETLPAESQRDLSNIFCDAVVNFKNMCAKGCEFITGVCFNKRQEGTAEESSPLNQPAAMEKGGKQLELGDEDEEVESGNKLWLIWRRKTTRNLLIVSWIVSFLGFVFAESFPLWCITSVGHGGLGLNEVAIGKILSCAGLIFAGGQYFVYALMVKYLGLYRTLLLCIALCVPLAALVPYSVPLNSVTLSSSSLLISWPATIFLAIINGTINILIFAFLPGIKIATNRSVPVHYRASMNGLGLLGVSIARGLGPTFAGWLVTVALSISSKVQHLGGSYIIFGTAAVMFGFASFATYLWLPEKEIKKLEEEEAGKK